MFTDDGDKPRCRDTAQPLHVSPVPSAFEAKRSGRSTPELSQGLGIRTIDLLNDAYKPSWPGGPTSASRRYRLNENGRLRLRPEHAGAKTSATSVDNQESRQRRNQGFRLQCARGPCRHGCAIPGDHGLSIQSGGWRADTFSGPTADVSHRPRLRIDRPYIGQRRQLPLLAESRLRIDSR